jgi:multiple sugar transport system substrate-binding protein
MLMAKTILKGITWGHSRGITPLLAAAQRFSELFPEVEIQWKKRSLQEFADFPIEKLTEQYDLLIIDHPWVGCAASTNCVLPLDQYLSAEFLNDQSEHSTGLSHQSYYYRGHQWALAIDAATPAASYRIDLFKQNKVPLPQTWEDVLKLAKEHKVAVPAIPIDLLMNFYTFCIAHGKVPFQTKEEVIDQQTGIKALETMQQLYSLVDKVMFKSNPIAVAEMMSKTTDYWYCPFAYCYSNYARTGYAENKLTYADVVTFEGQKLRTTIGGTGLSVSAFSEHKEIALQFAEMVTSGLFQSTFYVEHGGQPGHRSAWRSKQANRLTHNFFRTILPVMQRGYMRPRYNGYLYFQDTAGEPLHQFLSKGGNPETVLQEMNRLYRESLVHELKLQP